MLAFMEPHLAAGDFKAQCPLGEKVKDKNQMRLQNSGSDPFLKMYVFMYSINMYAHIHTYRYVFCRRLEVKWQTDERGA